MELKNISLNIALIGFEKELKKKKGKNIRDTFKEFIDQIKKSLSKEKMKITSPKKMSIACEIESKYFSYMITPMGIMSFQKSDKIEDETKLIKEFDNEFKIITDKVMQGLKEKHCAVRMKLGFSGDFSEFINNYIKKDNFKVKNIKSELDVIGIKIQKGDNKWQALISKDSLNLMLKFSCEEEKEKKCKGMNLGDLSIIEVVQDIKKLVGKI